MASPFFRVLGGGVVLMAAAGVLAADVEVIYSTRPGDTLIGLERQFLAPPFGWKGLQSLNHVPNPARMPVGSKLRIPEGWLRAEPRVARVLAVQGDVTVDGRPLAAGETLPGGARLRTGTEAFVTLLMPDDSRLTVQPGSLARLDKVQGFRGFDGQDTRVFLERGRLETVVTAQRGPAARYQV
ncbi:MAG: LysM peptidoglycan-binding domain-containing protein, partial [Zoogloea sp.]|nr:LysM peptidoglycan-binding domain-containing protein [Zoogloea sp.]